MTIYNPVFSDGEYVELYKKGGFHPVHLDDVLGERYRVCRKLGFGASSTVWLAKDLKSVDSDPATALLFESS